MKIIISHVYSADNKGDAALLSVDELTLNIDIRPNVKLGICGEHGGDPESIMLCHKLGLDYVSCSPFRVPVAPVAVSVCAYSVPTVATGSVAGFTVRLPVTVTW